MVVDRQIYKDGKLICTLWPKHNFTNLLTDSEIAEFKLQLAASIFWPEDDEERQEQVIRFNETMDEFISNCMNLGASKLVDYMIEDEGVEYRDE